jgi:hypothetical protein
VREQKVLEAISSDQWPKTQGKMLFRELSREGSREGRKILWNLQKMQLRVLSVA